MTVSEALDRYLEAAGRVIHRQDTRPLEHQLEAKVRTIFKRQREIVLAEFSKQRTHFQEDAAPQSIIAPALDAAYIGTYEDFFRALESVAESALVRASATLIATAGVPLKFDLKDPRAREWLASHAAERIKGIDTTTRKDIARIVQDGVNERVPYDTIARRISAAYTEFAIGKPQEHIASRAHLVAVTEVAEAYEEGSIRQAKEMQRQGLAMEKHWRDSGDDRVSNGCRENSAAGWIPLDQPFPSGHQHAPRFPGCRCYVDYRRIGSTAGGD
ncbi:MAG: phage minor head protein [bacterium]|jgi:hypothetical protein